MTLAENIIAFHHYALKAQHFEQTLNFYGALGFKLLHEWSLPSFQLKRCAMLYNPAIKVYLEICDRDASMPTQGRKRAATEEYVENALLHICFKVRDASLARLEALQLGATDLSGGASTLDLSQGDSNVRVTNSLVYSPNGEVIEFIEAADFGA